MAQAKTYHNPEGGATRSVNTANIGSNSGGGGGGSSSRSGGGGGGGGGSSNNRGALRGGAGRRNEEEHGLLATASFEDDDDDDDGNAGDSANGFVVHPGDSDGDSSTGTGAGANGNSGGSPKPGRTPHRHHHHSRVRFDLRPTNIPPPANGSGDGDGDGGELRPPDSSTAAGNTTTISTTTTTGTASPPPDYSRRPTRDHFEQFDLDDDDDDDDDDDYYGDNADPARTARRPLLTDIEAPSVTVANSRIWNGDGDGDGDDGAEGGGEAAREAAGSGTRSGLRPAFMNMANSIIGAGIIGQPYALRQAGLLAGVALLLALTAVVDWTIRLIVVNSKLSGASSFQGTVERCFGRPGLVAISLAQWLFAFGGMVAFGVIVGDSVPQVLRAAWPGLPAVPVLGLLADRRAVIVLCVLGVSYPLSLYRDIAKVSRVSRVSE